MFLGVAFEIGDSTIVIGFAINCESAFLLKKTNKDISRNIFVKKWNDLIFNNF